MSTPTRSHRPDELHARRRRATRRRLARVDIAIGVAGAAIIVLATPGLAIAALVALIVLILCGLSFAVEHQLARRRRRREEPDSRVGRL